MKMRDVLFISRVQEDREIALQLHDALEANNTSCWLAERDIPIGADWAADIIEAIDRCQLMIFILSTHSLHAPKQVLRELTAADQRNIPILCLAVNGTEPAKGLEYYLAAKQMIAISYPIKEVEFKTIHDAVTNLLSFEQICRRKYSTIEDLIRKKQWHPSIRCCLELLELGIRHLFDVSEDQSIREAAILFCGHANTDQSSRDWKNAVEDLTFPQLVKLLTQADVWKQFSLILHDPLHRASCTDWRQVIDISDCAVDCQNSLTEDVARDLAYWTKNFIYEFRLIGNPVFFAQAIKIPELKFVPADSTSSGNICCGDCNRPTGPDWSYCAYCGLFLKLECLNCHKALDPSWKRCPFCEVAVSKLSPKVSDSQRAEDEYRVMCRGAWLDGVVSVVEKRLLDEKRLELGLTLESADRIQRECAPKAVIDYSIIAEGVLVDGIITDIERQFLDRKAQALGIDSWTAQQIEETLQKTLISVSNT